MPLPSQRPTLPGDATVWFSAYGLGRGTALSRFHLMSFTGNCVRPTRQQSSYCSPSNSANHGFCRVLIAGRRRTPADASCFPEAIFLPAHEARVCPRPSGHHRQPMATLLDVRAEGRKGSRRQGPQFTARSCSEIEWPLTAARRPTGCPRKATDERRLMAG